MARIFLILLITLLFQHKLSAQYRDFREGSLVKLKYAIDKFYIPTQDTSESVRTYFGLNEESVFRIINVLKDEYEIQVISIEGSGTFSIEGDNYINTGNTPKKSTDEWNYDVRTELSNQQKPIESNAVTVTTKVTTTSTISVNKTFQIIATITTASVSTLGSSVQTSPEVKKELVVINKFKLKVPKQWKFYRIAKKDFDYSLVIPGGEFAFSTLFTPFRVYFEDEKSRFSSNPLNLGIGFGYLFAFGPGLRMYTGVFLGNGENKNNSTFTISYGGSIMFTEVWGNGTQLGFTIGADVSTNYRPIAWASAGIGITLATFSR